MEKYIWMFPKIVVAPKSSNLIRFSIINHPFWGTPIFRNTHIQIPPGVVFVRDFVGWFCGALEKLGAVCIRPFDRTANPFELKKWGI